MEFSNGRRSTCLKLCFVPQRYITACMISIGIISTFLLRICFGVVMKYIIKTKNSTKPSTGTKNLCNFTIEVHSATEGVYGWDPAVNSNFSDAFFYGYLIGHIPGGYLSDRYGGKHVFGLTVLFCGILTLITPIVIKATEEPTNVLIIRVLLGLIMAALFPAANTLISSWTPLHDRGKVVGIVYSATQFSSAINNIFTMKILLKISWPYVFYVFGGIAVGWWMIWVVLCYSNPITNPFVGDKERRYLEKELAGHVTYHKKEFPWKKILTSLGVWSFVIAQFGHTWIWHSMIRELPKYMREILKYDIASSHSIASLPYAVMGVFTIILGFLSDICINRKYLTLETTRKIFTTVGAMGPGIFTLGASFSGCNRRLSLTMFCLAMGQMSFYYAGTRPLGLDLAPNYSGFIMGLVNGLGAIPGVMQDRISRMITTNKTLEQWRVLFLVSLGILTVTNIFFVLFGTSKEQSWNSQLSKEVEGRRTKD